MARWPCRADGAYQLPTSAGAVEDNPVELALCDPGQLPHMLHRGGDIGKLRRLAWVTGDLMDAGDHGADLAESVECRGGLSRQVQLICAAKQPFNETIELLPTDQHQFSKPGSCFGNAGPDKAEGFAALLVPSETVPESIDERPDQLVDRIKAFEFGKLPAPQPLHGLEGRDRETGRSDAP